MAKTRISGQDVGDGLLTDADVAATNIDGATGTPSLRTLGTGAQQAAAGNDARLTDARTPTGSAGGDLSGTYPNPAIAQIGGKLLMVGIITPAQLVASAVDWNPTGLSGASIIRVSITAGNYICGLDGVADGRLIYLENVNGDGTDVYLFHEYSYGTASMRFWLPGSQNYRVPDRSGVWLLYDGTLARWTIVGTPLAMIGASPLIYATGSTTLYGNLDWATISAPNRVKFARPEDGGAMFDGDMFVAQSSSGFSTNPPQVQSAPFYDTTVLANCSLVSAGGLGYAVKTAKSVTIKTGGVLVVMA